MKKQLQIVKRDGSKEPLDISKFQKFIAAGCEGVSNVSPSMIEINSQVQFRDGMTSRELTAISIRSASDLIDEDHPEYSTVAAHYVLFDLRKDVYGSFTPKTWREQVEFCVSEGVYDKVLRTEYTDEELDTIESFIDHERDWNFTYGGIEQTKAKYLLKNRVTKVIYETPQMMYMRIAAGIFSIIQDKAERLQLIKDAYEYSSLWYFSLPTPIMAGAGTPTRQFSSCVGIKVGDDLDSIIEAGGHVVRYAAKRAGIGLDVGALRALGAGVRNGEALSTGLIPFIKKLRGDLKSCAQGAIRGASATVYFPVWHLEFPELIVLKNNKGTEENRERQLDYGVALNGYLLAKIVAKEPIYLFSPEQVPDLYKAFYADQAKFAELYEKYSRSRSVRKKKINGDEIGKMFTNERSDVGRIYPIFVDNANLQGPFNPAIDPIIHSNLCAEIMLPSKEFFSRDDPEGRIFLCTLASQNWGKYKDPKEMEKPCTVLVRLLDTLLAFQDYPTVQSKLATDDYRTLGVGILNYAYFLAKRGLKYGDEGGLAETKRFMEHQTYYLTKASIELAEKLGACGKWKDLSYAVGVFPWEKHKKGAESLTDLTPDPTLDWEGLRARMVVSGIRNATLGAIAPSETSSQPLGATNGFEPPMELISDKGSKDGQMKHFVPEIKRLKNKYQTKFRMGPDGTRNYLKAVAVAQVYICQSISANTFYVPKDFGGKLPYRKLMGDIVEFYNNGGKSLYYHLNYTGADDDARTEEEVCESCSV